MKKCMQGFFLLGVAFAGLVAVAAVADEPAKSNGDTLIVTDNNGKEHKLKTWKFTSGTRRLSWLATAEKEAPKDKPDEKKTAQARGPAKGPARGKPAAGPEALEFREENSTNFQNGILTFVPLERLRSLAYDNTKMTVILTAATGPNADDTTTLIGNTKFQGINKLSIEAEVDKGDLGIAEVKFLGGVAKGISAIKFPGSAKVEAQPKGRLAIITTKADSKGKSTHEVYDLQPLYRVTNGETLSTLLFFKKTLKIDVAKINRITVTDSGNDTAWGLIMKDGGEESFSLLTSVTLDGKAAALEGFIGRVPAGYKLFPVHVIEEIQFDAKPKKFDASSEPLPGSLGE